MEINLVPKFIDGALNPPAKAIGDSLANLWELGIGSHISLWVQKQDSRHKINLELYKEEIETRTQAIPEDFLKEPSMNIVGPAIEASKYYIDSEELRKLFANLISSSIDSRKSTKIHPSFVEVIKQLSPLDAENISFFQIKKNLPLCEYRTKKQGIDGYGVFLTNVFLTNKKVENRDLTSSSIANLNRLGLISTDYSTYRLDFDYEEFKKGLYYEQLALAATKQNPATTIDIQKGIAILTPFGDDFIKVCME